MLQRFADPPDMLRVVPEKALTRVAPTDREKYLQDASDEFASAADNVFTLPLISWSAEVRRDVATVATYECLAAQGFDSADLGSSLLRRAERVRTIWKAIREGMVPAGIVDSTPDEEEAGPVIVTSPRREFA